MSSKTFCVLPWKHLATHPHGGVTLCCISDHTNGMNRARNVDKDGNETMLDLNTSSIDKVMNSDYFQTVRMQMLSGIFPPACRRCYVEEENGIKSKRQHENEQFGFTEEDARAITSVIGHIPVDFKFIELRLGNLCNVKCRTCNPASSTQWTTEYQKLQQTLTFVTHYDKTMDTNWTESELFWDDLLLHSNDVELIYINGGEPTLVEKHWGYLQRLIDAGLNDQVTLWYNINMTQVPDKLLELWKQFKKVKISCSIDDLGERNSYIRSGTKWSDVIASLDKLQANSWIETSICQTVSIYNVYYLPEFHAFMEARGLHVHMNFVHDPAFLSAANMPDSIKAVIAERCKDLDPWKQDALINYLRPEADQEKLIQGLRYNSWLDKSRGTSAEKTFTELFELVMRDSLL